MILKTARLYVRYLSIADFAAFRSLEANPEVRKFTGQAYTVSEDAYRQFVSVPSVSCLAVCKSSDDSFIGRCGFRDYSERVELEIFLASAEHNRGYGRELLGAMIAHAEKAFPSRVIAATVSPKNARMIHLLKTFGFQDCGDPVKPRSGPGPAMFKRMG